MRLIRDQYSNKAKGFAYVQLNDHRSYTNALAVGKLKLKDQDV